MAEKQKANKHTGRIAPTLDQWEKLTDIQKDRIVGNLLKVGTVRGTVLLLMRNGLL
ncbi:MAG: hypothetical protein AAB343_00305 [Patescibacteria group bacterium]